MKQAIKSLLDSLPKIFNLFVQSWNVIFFALVMFGGIYLVAQGSYLWGVIVTVVGAAGAYFCLRQAQKWSEVKKEDLPKLPRQQKEHS